MVLTAVSPACTSPDCTMSDIPDGHSNANEPLSSVTTFSWLATLMRGKILLMVSESRNCCTSNLYHWVVPAACG